MRFGEDYKTYLLRTTVDAISDVATRYPSAEFFTKRTPISQAMQEELHKAISGPAAFMDVVFFQLRSVDLPDRYEDAIRKTEVTKQDIYKAQSERARSRIEQETMVQVATVLKQATLNDAQGQADSAKARVAAETETFKNIQEKQAEQYAALKTSLALTNEQLIGFLKGQLIKDYAGSKENMMITLPRKS